MVGESSADGLAERRAVSDRGRSIGVPPLVEDQYLHLYRKKSATLILFRHITSSHPWRLIKGWKVMLSIIHRCLSGVSRTQTLAVVSAMPCPNGFSRCLTVPGNCGAMDPYCFASLPLRLPSSSSPTLTSFDKAGYRVPATRHPVSHRDLFPSPHNGVVVAATDDHACGQKDVNDAPS
jgi:hypothetical protein